MRTLLSSLIIAAIAAGCATDHPAPEETGAAGRGRAELHVDAHALSAFGVTRVAVAAGDVTQDLTLDASTGTFDGALVLAPGTQSLVASAFAGDTLVGQSQPTPVTVQVGVVTRVLLHILDLGGAPPQTFGPIFDSISFPTTTDIGQPASFVLSVIAPAGDPVTYQWTSDCADAVLSAPHAATTQFTKPSAGACTIFVTATSNGYSVSQSFAIAVFPSGATQGAVQINTDFITAPVLALSLQDLGCSTFTEPMPINASCATAIASPTSSAFTAAVVDWGGSAPGTFEVTDSCGGQIRVDASNASGSSGQWTPALGAGTCFVTARAVNADGLTATLSLAVLVRPGVPANPVVSAVLQNARPFCQFGPASSPPDCGSIGSIFATQMNVFISLTLPSGHLDTMSLIDSCLGGSVPLPAFSSGEGHAVIYSVSPSGRTCTVTLHVSTIEGGATDLAALYH